MPNRDHGLHSLEEIVPIAELNSRRHHKVLLVFSGLRTREITNKRWRRSTAWRLPLQRFIPVGRREGGEFHHPLPAQHRHQSGIAGTPLTVSGIGPRRLAISVRRLRVA